MGEHSSVIDNKSVIFIYSATSLLKPKTWNYPLCSAFATDVRLIFLYGWKRIDLCHEVCFFQMIFIFLSGASSVNSISFLFKWQV